MSEYQYLDWDSDFFGFPICSLHVRDESVDDIKDIIDMLKKTGVRLVYLFAKSGISICELGHGGTVKPIDIRVSYMYDVTQAKHPNINANIEVRSAMSGKASNEMLGLALEAGYLSRFRIDPNIDDGKWIQLYELWLKNSLAGKIAEEVYAAYSLENILYGLATIKKRETDCRIGIISVNRESRGVGVGKTLLHSCIRYTIESNRNYLVVETQKSNSVANAFYSKEGFVKYSECMIYHVWL